MVNVFDVAQYILEKTGEINAWKLQKLCYYSQAWHYVWTEEPLFPERFEAWSNGPVCPPLFQAHDGHYSATCAVIGKGDPKRLNESERESVDIIIKDYGDITAYALRELSHVETTWKTARGNLPDGAKCKNVITLESMKDYYGSL